MKITQSLLLASAIASSAVMVAATAPTALAVSLVPQEQTEIEVGLGCLDISKCIETSELQQTTLFQSITSQIDATTKAKSRLFVDYFGPDDQEISFGNTVKFQVRDAGTNPAGFWFRPSEVTEEQGQLEVGTFTFEFQKTIAELVIDFFDTETTNTTGILAINGVNLSSPDYVASGANGNITSKTLFDVKSITLKLGKDTPKGTGDGVDFQMASVPEPASILGLLAIAGGGLFAKKKQQ